MFWFADEELSRKLEDNVQLFQRRKKAMFDHYTPMQRETINNSIQTLQSILHRLKGQSYQVEEYVWNSDTTGSER